MLCVECVESRLESMLTPADFIDAAGIAPAGEWSEGRSLRQ